MPRPRRIGVWFGNPVRSGNRWRILRRGGPSDKANGTWIYFDSEREAKAAKRVHERDKATSARLVGEAVNVYLVSLNESGAATNTVKAVTNFLAQIFPDPAEEIGDIGPQHYEALRKRPGRSKGSTMAAATHQRGLRAAQTFLNWCVSKGWLRRNTLADVKPIGKARKGKAQLTLDEAAQWMAVAESLAPAQPAALGALLCAVLGMRVSEVLSRQVRDLDRGGTVLWVCGKGKDERVPLDLGEPETAFLLPLLATAARGKLPLAPLVACTEAALTYWNRQISKQAGVPVVCPHSLRGLHSSAGLEGGAAIAAVCRVLRHGVGIDRQHYARPGAEAAGNRRSLLRAVRGSDTSESDPQEGAG